MAALHEELKRRLARVEDRIAAACARAGRARSEVTLVAVTKTTTIEVVSTLLDLGLFHFGENRPQELWKKAEALPEATWHFIGHLQRNKIDKTIPLASLIHSADRPELLEALSAFSQKSGRPISVLLQVNASREENKGGFAPEAIPTLSNLGGLWPGLRVEGLMTMAAFDENPEQCRPVFALLRSLRDQLRANTGLSLPHLSMGMSNDFEIAIEEGATLIRLGSVLFEGLP
jgi:pyridoxal phosphate enzyme (YggS family)